MRNIAETLKFRFIGLNLSIEKVRELFNYREEKGAVMSQEEEQWKKEYINMDEVQSVLQGNSCFGLNEESSRVLARYLVEDSQNDYVYCDPAN